MEVVTRPLALVTGAAGDIGAATAARLIRAGYCVVVTDRRRDDVERVAAALSETGGEAIAIVCDQTDPDSVEALFSAIETRGALRAAFINAGYGSYGALLDQDFEIWRRHIDVNLNGAFLMSRGAARLMSRSGGGSIVVNTSTAAHHECDLLGAYAASKAGLAMMARTLAAELGNHGIRVNTVMPGVIETAMTRSLLADPATHADMLAETPVGRLGKADDIAALVAFLCSDEAGYITGAEILIDGGQTLHGYPRWFRQDYGTRDTWRPQSSGRVSSPAAGGAQ